MWLDNYYIHQYAIFAASSKCQTSTGSATTGVAPCNVSSKTFRTTNGTKRSYIRASGYPANPFAGSIYPGIVSQTTNAGSDDYGTSNLVVGSGTTPVTASDYKIESEITSLSFVACTYEYDTESGTVTRRKTMTNTSSETITISEIGLVGFVGVASNATTTSASESPYLGYREVLESPITVAPGETFTVTVTLQFPLP